MGFPSPAQDYVESRISLDRQLISRPAATYFMRASETCLRAGIIKGALLVVDTAATQCDGSILACAIDGEFRLRRLRLHPHKYLERLDTGARENHGSDDEPLDVFGVVTYIINDARLEEFDDNPCM
ncbi:LexA family transcriptional regulator [Enterobacter sp. Ap-916]|uniref:HumD family translesion DNA polymerase n=1 Tax=Enterobacteriaceae TaxID=543 RepID=UPI000272B054|nr:MULTISPECIES: S24 family peptidase [unclassified Enterobacter]EJF31677.1 DNA polymerase V subunit [Enterobacter sp. Ag1]NIF57557.1 LexA family transcriptional regulator [Enterobacter sp. Ap-867]NIG28500.1 LexA family transcriptional regulator [Enterobacter sp. Ap-916]